MHAKFLFHKIILLLSDRILLDVKITSAASIYVLLCSSCNSLAKAIKLCPWRIIITKQLFYILHQEEAI